MAGGPSGRRTGQDRFEATAAVRERVIPEPGHVDPEAGKGGTGKSTFGTSLVVVAVRLAAIDDQHLVAVVDKPDLRDAGLLVDGSLAIEVV